MSDNEDLAENDVAAATLDELTMQESTASEGGSPDLEVVLDIPVKIAMEVGSTQISIRNLTRNFTLFKIFNTHTHTPKIYGCSSAYGTSS